MSGLRDGWYISEPDGEAVGPISRTELATRAARGAFTAEALAWHVDLAEWQPLAKVAAGTTGASGDANTHATPLENRNYQPASQREPESAQSRREPAQSKRERKQARKQIVDDGVRLMSSGAQSSGARQPALAKSPPPAPGTAPHSHVRAELFERNDPATKKPADAVKAEAAKNAALAGLGVRRFLARLIDTMTLGMAGAAAIWGWFAPRIPSADGTTLEPPSVMLLVFLSVLALIPLEALALAFTGTTPAKALLGVRVTRGGARPGFGAALGRSFAVAWRGMGLGIPLFSLIAMVVGFVRLMNKGVTSWDEKTGMRTEGSTIAGGRWQAALIGLIGAFSLLNSGFWPDLAWRIANRVLPG